MLFVIKFTNIGQGYQTWELGCNPIFWVDNTLNASKISFVIKSNCYEAFWFNRAINYMIPIKVISKNSTASISLAYNLNTNHWSLDSKKIKPSSFILSSFSSSDVPVIDISCNV
ncbi:hypothetical protein KYB31_20090 [Clostridium felsineum]|uniref:hypothetical protein n=1 Tax=Clostridium felsineum TaxID=36839 RepID=UPI00098C2561|nr:hypothetical protein [Clostridium felsineum]MCR3761280.1 hypothetical protein [Clostridium felsineum]URZ01529.1 hypothetical protein CLAUR_015240 [Clostridium felsineum]URZ17422.1 hypothetical protein CLFE_034750 [Clostridium felsineum DSM 794]